MNFKHALIITVIANPLITSAYAQIDPHLEIVPTVSMPLNAPHGEQEKISPKNMTIASNGKLHARDSRKVADFRRNFETALSSVAERPDDTQREKHPPAAVRDVSKLQIAFIPRRIDDSHHLIVASPAGMLTSNGWSGLERFISIPDGGKFKLTEFDLTKTGGKFSLSSEAVNSSVDNSPAGAKSFLDDQNNILEEIVWVSDGHFYMLTYLPDTTPNAASGHREKRTPSISATSLAQGLRK